MEEIVLLETTKAYGKKKSIFRMQFARAEFDMVVYDNETNTCECYEIKHSDQIVDRQMQYLVDPEYLHETERKFGPITKRCVLYRGPSKDLDNGVIYKNVEEYLCEL